MKGQVNNKSFKRKWAWSTSEERWDRCIEKLRLYSRIQINATPDGYWI